MINVMQQRNIIGKVLSKPFNSENKKLLLNKVDSIKRYTEADHRNENEKDMCLRNISREIDESVKFIDEMKTE